MASVLIVDDYGPMRRLLRTFLRNHVEVIYECEDGAEVLSSYSQYLPDWVLMDIEMKNMDGLTATRSLLQSFPKARVIILSKQGDQYMYEAARQAGACAYVPKENVLVVLHSILSKSPVANLMFAV